MSVLKLFWVSSPSSVCSQGLHMSASSAQKACAGSLLLKLPPLMLTLMQPHSDCTVPEEQQAASEG